MNAITAISTILPAEQLFVHECGKNTFNEAVTELTADKEIKWFANLVAFRIGNSPRHFWRWEGALK
jgi:hypothetical protein